MKKLFVAIAMVMGLGTAAMAQDNTTAKDSTQTAQPAAEQAPKFEEIDITTVPSVVADAFKTTYPEAQVSKAASATIKGVLVYKFTYKAADGDKFAYFTAEGKEVK